MKTIRTRAVLLLIMAVFLVIGMTSAAYASGGFPGNQIKRFTPAPNTGYLDLKIKDQNEGWKNGVSSTWNVGNMAPGIVYPLEGSFDALKVNAPSALDIACIYRVSEERPVVEPDANPYSNWVPDRMAKSIILTRCVYGSSFCQIDCLTGAWKVKNGNRWLNGVYPYGWALNDVDRDGKKTFFDLKYSPLANLPLPKTSPLDVKLEISVKFAADAGNQFQGDAFKFDMIYTARSWDLGGICGFSSREFDRCFFAQ
jgi:hypothetical protein